MSIEVIAVQNKKDKKRFIDFEWQINKNTPNWISPLYMERQKVLDTRKNPFYQHAKIQLFLGFKEGRLAGRIAAVTNQNHNDFHEDNSGFWGFFECVDDAEVAGALFDAARDWLKAEGKDAMLGPMNPSTNDECGMLVDGFDTPPYLMMTHNPTYYPALVEACGMTKAKDLYAWLVSTETAKAHSSEKLSRVADKIMQKYKLTIRNIRVKNIKSEVPALKEVYNNAWSRNWGFVPFTDAEFDAIAADLKDIADEDFLFMAEKEGEPIGFGISLPNINEIMARIPNGKLLPFGIFKLLTGMKKIKTVRTIILGVKKEYQHIGLGAIFYLKSIQAAERKGLWGGEMSWILEDNIPMNKAIEGFGSKRYKTYRIYSQSFTG